MKAYLPKMKINACLLACVCIAMAAALEAAAPAGGRNGSAAWQLHDMQSAIRTLQYNTDNHSQELQQAQERFNTMDDIIQGLRKELDSNDRKQQEQAQTAIAGLKLKIRELEGDVSRLTNELQQTREALGQLPHYRKSLEDMQKQNAVRDKNLENLHSALNAMMEALQGQESEKKAEAYRVKSGDTLEKIANAHKTSVKAIKELNGLASDRIRLGQELKIP
jgi:chromosome segregation ATPase